MIRILTDSASDIEQNEFSGITVIPLTVTIDGEDFRDGIDLNKDEFYRRLETSDTMPVTSLITPYRFGEIFRQVQEAGDEAIVLPISSGLSGTFQSAMTAAADYPAVSVVDTKVVAGAQRILVLRALELVNQGLSRAQVVEALEKEKQEIVIYAVVDTLKYLQKGGRISKSTAVVGGIMGIKPILALEDGKLVPIAKARGSRQGNAFLNEKIKAHGGVDFARPYCAIYAGTDRTPLEQYIRDNENLLNGNPIPIAQIGSAVGTHCGPGTIAVTFFAKG